MLLFALSAHCRQDDANDRTRIRRRVDTNIAAVSPNDSVGPGQAQASVPRAALGGVKGIKDPLQLLAVHSGTTDGDRATTLDVSWTPPTNADGSIINDLAGFKIYCGSRSRDYSIVADVGFVTEYTLSLPEADFPTIYLSVTTYDFSGTESVFSGEEAVSP